jgi:CheY-like chemotaxis protein
MDDHTKRILLVDDDENVRFLLDDLFTQEGYHVYDAADGLEAIAEMKKRHHDVVLCDYHMPHMDGLAFLEVSQIVWPHTPVIIASCDPELNEQTMSRRVAGAYACLSKPFDLDQLLSTVQEAASPTRSSTFHCTADR